MGSPVCGGPGESLGGLRMCLRSHSRDCAGQTLGPHLRMRPTTRLFSIKLCQACRFNSCVRVFFIPWGHVSNHAQIWAYVTSISHMGEMRDSDWSRQNLLRSDWSGPRVALITTDVCLLPRPEFISFSFHI